MLDFLDRNRAALALIFDSVLLVPPVLCEGMAKNRVGGGENERGSLLQHDRSLRWWGISPLLLDNDPRMTLIGGQTPSVYNKGEDC